MIRATLVLAAAAASVVLLAPSVDARTTDPGQAVVAQRLAQGRDAATCARWRADLRNRIDGFNRSCSGALSPTQAATCEAEKRRLDDEMSQFNSQCAG